MKGLKVTQPAKETDVNVIGINCGFNLRRVGNHPPIRYIRLKLDRPLNGEGSIQFNPGEPGFAALAAQLDMEDAIGAALAARFPDAKIKALPKKDSPAEASAPAKKAAPAK